MAKKATSAVKKIKSPKTKIYTIYCTQPVTADVRVSFKIETNKSLEDLQSEIEQKASKWLRLSRLSVGELESDGIKGYIKDSFTNELEFEGDEGGEVEADVEEMSS